MTDSRASVFFDGKVYSAEAVRLAAYVFAGRAEIKLSAVSGGVRAEMIWPGAGADLPGEFGNEVLNQQCRLDLGPSNRKISEMIVTRALLSAAGGEASAEGKE